MSTPEDFSSIRRIFDILDEHPILLDYVDAVLEAINRDCADDEITRIGEDVFAKAKAKNLSEDEWRHRVKELRAEALKQHPEWFASSAQ